MFNGNREPKRAKNSAIVDGNVQPRFISRGRGRDGADPAWAGHVSFRCRINMQPVTQHIGRDTMLPRKEGG
jgi:hypothetical protein